VQSLQTLQNAKNAIQNPGNSQNAKNSMQNPGFLKNSDSDQAKFLVKAGLEFINNNASKH
jgi:hypothetical protein